MYYVTPLSLLLSLTIYSFRHALQEFDYKVRIWSGKKDTMDLKISMFDTNSAPSWVTQTKPEPSSVSSCTPSSKRSRAPPRVELTTEALGLSTRLFPTSAVKAPLVRDRSDTTLTQDMSHSSISSNLFSSGATSGQGKSPRTKADARETSSSKQSAASRQSPRSPRSAVSSPRQPIAGPSTAKQSPAQSAPNGVVPRYVAPIGVGSPALVVPPRGSMSTTPGAPLSYRNVANGAATSGNGFVSPTQHMAMAYAYPPAPGMLPVFVSTGQMGEGPVPVPVPVPGAYPAEMGMLEYPVLAGAAPLQQGSGLRSMPFPLIPGAQSPRYAQGQGQGVPPMHGAGHSPPKRVRKDASSSSTMSNGSGSGSSSSSLDGVSQNGQRRKK